MVELPLPLQAARGMLALVMTEARMDHVMVAKESSRIGSCDGTHIFFKYGIEPVRGHTILFVRPMAQSQAVFLDREVNNFATSEC